MGLFDNDIEELSQLKTLLLSDVYNYSTLAHVQVNLMDALYMKISLQSIITRHCLKNLRNDIGIVRHEVSLSGHLIKWALLINVASKI